MGLAAVLTSWGKQWRTTAGFPIPGFAIGFLAVLLLFTAGGLGAAKTQADLENAFTQSGDKAIAEARHALQLGDAEKAEAAIAPFTEVKDARVQALVVGIEALRDAGGDKAEAAQALLKRALREKKNGMLYSAAIQDLDPALIERLAAQEAKAAEARAKEEQLAAEQERFTTHFSKWDGSHPAVVAAVKRNMHDPSSFKHVETTAKGLDDTIIVSMTYRGTNGFGGVVTNQVVAVVDTDGNLKSIAAAP